MLTSPEAPTCPGTQDTPYDCYKDDDYKTVYQKFVGNFLSISPELGRFIYACARAQDAKRIVEFGLPFGISAIYLACALRDNVGGRIIRTMPVSGQLIPAKSVGLEIPKRFPP
jgi:hypothetical protein